MRGFLLCFFALVSLSYSLTYDITFNGINSLCARILAGDSAFVDSQGKFCREAKNNIYDLVDQRVRVRVMDPPSMPNYPGFRLERPFLVVDGIHLDPNIPRSIADFEADVQAYGLPNILKSLGYTPVLVQFPYTVELTLERNAKSLSMLLDYLAKAKVIPWSSPLQDGFVVFGISQGGILGRYGSYLYDISRKSNEPQIRFFASLDSPHQGAVIPRGVLATINFWSEQGVYAAEDFADMISAPGARELLLYDSQMGGSTLFSPYTSAERWLFGAYRKAAEYKGFPSVLLSEGQIRGKDNEIENLYYELNRYAEKFSKVWGRAISRVSYSNSEDKEFSYNRVYESPKNHEEKRKGKTKFDKVQGSTYPFGTIMYNAMKEGMLEEIPNNMKVKFPLIGNIKISTKWDDDVLNTSHSTFIPTTSALDLKCNGNLSVDEDCLQSQTENGLDWENPGNRSTASSMYAVDKTHPRANEKISGQHVEFPNGNSNVMSGIQTDMWRLFCELSKADYDLNSGEFNNPYYKGFFDPSVSCMDSKKMPVLIKNAGLQTKEKFSWVRYDYAPKATEANAEVSFELPAGWQKVVKLDYGKGFPANSVVEVKVKMTNPKSNWLKAEFLLTRQKNGGSQIQLEELSVKPDGSYYTLRWKIPGNAEILKNYRFGRLVLNSAGGDVSITSLNIIKNALVESILPKGIPSEKIYPSSDVNISPWKRESQKKEDSLSFYFEKAFDGVFLEFSQTYSLEAYKTLKVAYKPGTCQEVRVYFDVLLSPKSVKKLGNGNIENELEVKEYSLTDLIERDFTDGGILSASKLILQNELSKTSCEIKSIELK